jgi:hypothetical protein
MIPARHPNFKLQQFEIGRERARLVMIDNFVADPEALVDTAAGKVFSDVATYFPGLRARVPLSYQQFVLETLRPLFGPVFGLNASSARFTACHFSVVTTPPEQLTYLQRIPHVDSMSNSELAFVHYLFHGDFGGTAFYRHRKTGFEYVDRVRESEYLRQLAVERDGPDSPAAAYINGDTPLYEQIDQREGVFNRLIIYRRTSLHSGALRPGFVPDPNPRTGRLSVNGFITT